MKKITTRLLFLLMILSTIVPAYAATVSEPVATNTAKRENPPKESVDAALKDFKNLSRKEKKARFKEVKKAIKEYRAMKKEKRDDGDVTLLLLVILAILLPPLAVWLKEGEINVKFWISLLLCLLVFLLWPLWLIAVAYALLVVFDQL
jgi:uncharacterized membrane protein YqaE (UPF0057 family)